MAAAAAPASSASHLKDEAVVLSWADSDNDGQSLGHIITLTTTLSRDTSKTATFRLRVPFQFVKNTDSCFYIFIDLARIKYLYVLPDKTMIPDPVSQAFVGKGLSSHEILGLELCLETAPVIVGPANLKRLAPRGRAPGNTLATLRSLSQCTELRLFMPRSQGSLRKQLCDMCEAVNERTLTACVKAYDPRSLYCGEGGRDVSDLLAHFEFRTPNVAAGSRSAGLGLEGINGDDEAKLGAEEPVGEPPAYDDTVDTVPGNTQPSGQRVEEPPAYEPRSTPQAPGKRRASSSPSPPTVKRPYITSETTTSLPPLTPETKQLRLDLEALKSRNSAPYSPTEVGSIACELESFDARLQALETRINDFTSFDTRLLALERRMHAPNPAQLFSTLLPLLQAHFDTHLDNRLEDCVAQKVELHTKEHIADVDDRLDELRNDIDATVKWRVEEQVEGRLDKVVAEQLPDVAEEIFENAQLSLKICR